jgi:hypothetical protein
MSTAGLDDAATEAIRTFSAEITVVVNPTGGPEKLGSGILMHRDGHGPFVITAAHVVEDDPFPVNIAVSALRSKSRIRNAVASIHRAPQANGHGVDVAVLILTDEAKTELSPYGAPYTAIREITAIADDDYIVLTGSPTAMMRPDKAAKQDGTGRPQLDVDVVQLFYVTSYKGRDPTDRILVEWDDAVVSGATTTAARPGWVADNVIDLGSPVGISGAGLWRFTKPVDGELWSPRSHCQLLGVASAWNTVDTEYCVPTDHFATWLDGLF